MIWPGYVTGRLFGWTVIESLFTGALIAISSTTIIVKAFAEQGVKGKLAEFVFGILIVEDLIAILLLAVLTPVASGAGLSAGELAWTIGRLCAFLVGMLVVGILVVPRFVRLIVKHRPHRDHDRGRDRDLLCLRAAGAQVRLLGRARGLPRRRAGGRVGRGQDHRARAASRCATCSPRSSSSRSAC